MRKFIILLSVLIYLMAAMALLVPFIAAVKFLLLGAFICWKHHYKYSLAYDMVVDYFTLSTTLSLLVTGALIGFIVWLPICWKLRKPQPDPLDKYFK